MPEKHLDEARQDTLNTLGDLLTRADSLLEKAVLIEDLFGLLRPVLWSKNLAAQSTAENDVLGLRQQEVADALRHAAGCFWGDLWWVPGKSGADREIYERSWAEGREVGESTRLRVADRWRNRTAWRHEVAAPPWRAASGSGGPPIVVFHSFKGGVGRTTALSAFAIQRARLGERVVVVDLDLGAPGVGTLLAADEKGTTARWGVADYWLERPRGQVDLSDYYHVCRRPTVTGGGEIFVVPAGSLEPGRDYLGKLARIDFEPVAKSTDAPFPRLLAELREALEPRWILLDGRAGLSEPAGLLLEGIAHLHVLFGTSSEQSWKGLRLILDRLGASRVLRGERQLDCLLVQALVPENSEIAAAAREGFSLRALEEFSAHYYARDPKDPGDDRFWYVRDGEDEGAPSSPVAIPYRPPLAFFSDIEAIASELAESEPYRAMASRITQGLAAEDD
ncbi:MAG: KGGVGR-motif variant AAA ATPase [Myxococcales bacterium]